MLTSQIVSIDPIHGTAKIFYVDYGDTEVADLQGLKCIPDEFAQLPTQSLCCSLWGLCATEAIEDGGWHSDTKTLMEDFIG